MKSIQLVSSVLLSGLISIIIAGCSGGGNAEVDVVDPSTLPPEEAIFEVAARGDVAGMGSLLSSDPSLLNIQDDAGRTPLHFAAGNNQKRMVDFLLDKGADPLVEDENSEIPADAARQQGYTSLANTLMEAAESAE